MPSSPTSNRYACLSVEDVDTDTIEQVEVVKDIPELRKRRVHRKRWERRLPKKYIVASTPSEKSLMLDIEVESTDNGLKRATKSLLDCGATGLFMDRKWVTTNNLPSRTLTTPIPVFNVDGTPNEAGAIREIVDVILRFEEHTERAQFAVTSLGNQDMILGYSWLEEHNPDVDWKAKIVSMSRCPPRCSVFRRDQKEQRWTTRIAAAQIRKCRMGSFPVLIEEIEDEDNRRHPEGRYPGQGPILEDVSSLFPDDLPDLQGDDEDDDVEEEDEPEFEQGDTEDVKSARIEDDDRIFVATIHPEDPSFFVRATSTISQRLAEAFSANSEKKSFKDLVPESLHEFEDVFSKESFDSLPERRKWDHAIELERADD
jgi:hypothetical protein